MSWLPGPLLPGGGQTINPRPVWVPDSMSKECMVCGQRFTAFNRKHHCRQCGRVVCSTCSPHRVQLDGPAEGKPERVCSGCVKEVTTVKSKGQSLSQSVSQLASASAPLHLQAVLSRTPSHPQVPSYHLMCDAPHFTPSPLPPSPSLSPPLPSSSLPLPSLSLPPSLHNYLSSLTSHSGCPVGVQCSPSP